MDLSILEPGGAGRNAPAALAGEPQAARTGGRVHPGIAGEADSHEPVPPIRPEEPDPGPYRAILACSTNQADIR